MPRKKITPVILDERRRTFLLAFRSSMAGQEVLRELAAYCFADSNAYDKDPYEHARKAGRREVWLHIKDSMNLSVEDMWYLLSGNSLKPEELSNAPDA